LTEASFAEGQGGLLSGGAQRHAAGHPHRDVRSF